MDEPKQNDYPPVEIILTEWLPSKDVATMHSVTQSDITGLCRRGTLRSIRLGREWYIDPKSAKSYIPGQRGRKVKN